VSYRYRAIRRQRSNEGRASPELSNSGICRRYCICWDRLGYDRPPRIGTPKVGALPDLSGTFLVLLGISYAGYLGGKLPTQTGLPSA